MSAVAIRPELRDELMRLSADERIKLADELYASVPSNDDDTLACEQEWAEELARRVDEIRSGKVEGIPGDAVFSRLRERLAARD